MLAMVDAILKIKQFNGNTGRNPIAVTSKWQPGESKNLMSDKLPIGRSNHWKRRETS